jgi:hypothetical protein
MCRPLWRRLRKRFLLRDFSNAIMFFSEDRLSLYYVHSVIITENFQYFPFPSNINQISSNLIVLALAVVFATIFKFSSICLFFFQIKFFDDDSIWLDSDFYVTRLFDWIIFIKFWSRYEFGEAAEPLMMIPFLYEPHNLSVGSGCRGKNTLIA